MIFFQCAFSCKLSSAFLILPPFKPRLKPREKIESGGQITYFFTKSIRFRVKKTCPLRKLNNRCRFRTSTPLMRGSMLGGGGGGGGGGGQF